MLNGLFGEDDDAFQAANDAVLASFSHSRGTRNMADEVELPPLPRKSFVGLKNQGATCYLNSFYQSLFMMPPIQKIFLELDLQQLFGTGGLTRLRHVAIQNPVRHAKAVPANEAARPAKPRHGFHEQVLRLGGQRGAPATRHPGGSQNHPGPGRARALRHALLRAVHPHYPR